MLAFLLIAIFFVCFGFLFAEGMWSNAVRLINVVTSALLATSFFEPVAVWLEGWGPSYTYAWDFLALWGLFGLFMTIFRGATDFISKVKVRFRTVTDQIGSPFFAACIGWAMVCFTMMTLHTAPLGRNFMKFRPEDQLDKAIAPDLQWLAFVQKMSLGAFSRPVGEEHLRKKPEWKEQWEEDGTLSFDPRSEFMPKYATRRTNLENYMKKPGTKSIRVGPEDLPK